MIQKGVPIPRFTGNRNGRAAVLKMLIDADVGDSVVVQGTANQISSSMTALKRGSGWWRMARERDGLYRVWKLS